MIELRVIENADSIPANIDNIISDNKYFLDNDNYFKKVSGHDLILSYVNTPDCRVYIIYLNNIPSGFLIFDTIRKVGCDISATVHPCLSKVLWGKNAVIMLTELMSRLHYTTLHCEVPDIAIHTCRLALNCGFKKVGAKSKVLPYTNALGETSLRDVYMYEWRKENE